MTNEEIREKIDSFPNWHFAIDLKGSLTREMPYRQMWRKEYFFDPLVAMLGGSLEGKRVLDLACNAGFWSLSSAEAGCDYVLGIDYEQMHIEQSNLVFEVKEVDKSRYDFILGDLYETDFARFGPFDVVLCPGLMYHINKPMELVEKISQVNSDVLLIDTRLSDLPGSAIEVRKKGGKMHPTREAVRDMVKRAGYSVKVIKPYYGGRDGNDNPKAELLGDYLWPHRRGRRAFICAKETNLRNLPVDTEPVELPEPRPQKRSPEAGGADGARRLLRRTDQVLSGLFASRRWKLANAFGEALQVVRKVRGQAPEDRLRELRGEIRASLQRSDHAPSEQPAKKDRRQNGPG